MLSLSNKQLEGLPYAVDLAGKRGYFYVEHTHEDGSKETCRVTSGTDEDGLRVWTLGAYTTKTGTTHLAVVAGKVLKNIKVVKKR